MKRNVLRASRPVGLLVLLAAVLTAGAPSIIRIHRGDTLSGIAQRYGTSVSALKRVNHLHSDTIYIGELLRIPGNNVGVQAAPATHVVNRVYVVRSGDNLTALGHSLHHSVTWLKAENRLHSDVIDIGQRLVYGVTVVRSTASAPTTTVGSVSASAAYHRHLLHQMSLPSKSAVRALIRSAARRHGVPVSLALALSYQESGFQQRVVSPVDAIGAMQVLPSTGRSLGEMHGRSYDLLRASDNVEAGVTLIGDLIRATGSVPKALGGYYQGLGSISRIGYLPQTRQYIKNIELLRRDFS